jgi:hypothetical protein
MILVLYAKYMPLSFSFKSWDRRDGNLRSSEECSHRITASFICSRRGFPFKIRRLSPPRHRESPLPKRPRCPTSRLSIPSTIPQNLGLFSSAFAALILPPSSPLGRSQDVLVPPVLPYLPLHRRYYEQSQINPGMVQLQPQSGASPTPFRQTLLRFGLASEWSPMAV